MAGSYHHIVDTKNNFRGVELLDNLGDAYEALEECHAMIKYLTKNNRRKIFKAWRDGYAKKNCPKETYGMLTFDYFWKGEDYEDE